ncbi:MAG: RNA-binding S4 domain-containing protein, partial [Bacteroidia bacterium]
FIRTFKIKFLHLRRTGIFAFMSDTRRADKWLWSVRLYKTRTQAADACKGGKVKLNGDLLKPAKELKPGDEISFKFGIITKTVCVLDFPPARVAAKLVPQFLEDRTAPEEYERLKAMKELGPPVFHSGKGRPTKRDRRRLDNIF